MNKSGPIISSDPILLYGYRLEMQENPSDAVDASESGNNNTSIHVTALDGIVSVNSLFTMAIFIGFSMTGPPSRWTTSNTASSPPRPDRF
ncbi:hypothetical protein SASPL_129477 [Salvia splendens]|uniref:Uncharacterized protein n=1 Tax=Salvia splendens TaxID=180675 RepID=A0A8X8XCT8_SALSN|nr:hypothetical protein SASPL_129477 [Salvia splendens]